MLICLITNKYIGELILRKRYYNLLEMTITSLDGYSIRELSKISRLLDRVSVNVLECVLSVVPLVKLTKYNIIDLHKYVRDSKAYICGAICMSWGPGNNGNAIQNMIGHRVKHETELAEMLASGRTAEDYIAYTVDVFYYMRDVCVHTNGRGSYMSGFFDDMFIVGRYDGEQFGISSCYRVHTGIKEGRLKDLCFYMWR